MEPTDSKSIASLLDSECDIPFDVHFEIEYNDGNKLETLGGHKALLALKSPVFKAMLFGPMKESGKVVKIKGTTVFAFKTLLLYIHEVEEEWWPWAIDVHELVRVVDLAETPKMGNFGCFRLFWGYQKWPFGCPNQNSKTTFQHKYPP